MDTLALRKLLQVGTLAAALVGLMGACAIVGTIGGTVQVGQTPTSLRAQRPAMGTTFTIVVWGPVGSGRRAAMDRAFQRVADVEEVLTDYEASSEARRVTEHGSEWVHLSPLLAQALSWGQRLVQETQGRVDPTAGPVTRLWRRSLRQGELPRAEVLGAALDRVGMEHLLIERVPDRLRCLQEGMRLDFGAFGKGLAIDHAFESLLHDGFDAVLVEGGGDLRVGAPPHDHPDGWAVLLESAPGTTMTLFIQHLALATSGNRYQTVTLEGRRYGHIIDLKSGLGTETLREATVTADSACRADGWATALCLWGPTGFEFLPDGMEARVVEIRARGSEGPGTAHRHPEDSFLGASWGSQAP